MSFRDHQRKASVCSQLSTDSTVNEPESPGNRTWRDEHRTWIPASHPQRTLVLCFDGTGDEFDSDVRKRILY
jgi:hypothetical protein